MRNNPTNGFDNNQFFEELRRQTANDPTSKGSAQLILFIAMVIGIIAVLVSAKIGFGFFDNIFPGFGIWALITIGVFELGKISFISLYELFSSKLSKTIVGVIAAGRAFFIIFSIIASFSKVSEYMNEPNFSSVWSERKNELDSLYKVRYNSEDRRLSIAVQVFQDTMYLESRRFKNGQWRGPRFYNDSLNWAQAKHERAVRLDSIQQAYDSLLGTERANIHSSPEAKNQMLLGIHTTFKNAGISSQEGFNKFYAWFVLVISLLLSIGLELIIWGCFGVVSRIFKDPVIARIDTFNESSKTIENVKREKTKEDAKTFSFGQKISNFFKRKTHPVEALNRAIEETDKINF
jgi:hypothetical protein